MGIPFFSSKQSLAGSGVLGSFTDCHSHILPGVDDGVKTLADSLAVLSYYEELGIREVWLTPHIMEDVPNAPAALRSRFEELTAAYSGTIILHLGAENMLDALFEERLSAGDLLPVGSRGNFLLVETSYFNPPMRFHELLDAVKSKGYHPLLAHPERYTYMRESDYEGLRGKGVFFQLNLTTLAGAFGEEAKRKAEWLLSKGYADCFGSDVHRLGSLKRAFAYKCVKKSMIREIDKINNKQLLT